MSAAESYVHPYPGRSEWPEYFDRVLPRHGELTWRDLAVLDYRELWQYELVEGVLYCSPLADHVADLTWRDVQDVPAASHWTFEMIDGMLIVTANAPNRIHQVCALSLGILLRKLCPPQMQVIIAPFAYVSEAPFSLQPDLLVASRPIGEKRLEHTPSLVVEVLSDSTRLRDLGLKRFTYERGGVPHFWVVDPALPSIEAYQLHDGSYRVVATATRGQIFVAEEPLPVSFDPLELLDP